MSHDVDQIRGEQERQERDAVAAAQARAQASLDRLQGRRS